MSDVLGGIKVNKMIWFATCLTLGSLYICWNSYDKPNPAIIETTLEYPYTIIFRVGMMYSLFIYFLIVLFIKWWIDSSGAYSLTKPISIMGTLGLLSYGLFVACIDRKRINYPLAKKGAFFAGLLISLTIMLIMNQLKKIRQTNPMFIGQTSWNLKKIIGGTQNLAMIIAVLIALGQVSIDHRNKVQYLIVITTILFFWTFIFDFKRFKMDIDQIPKLNAPQITQPQPQNPYNRQFYHTNQSIEMYQ